DDLSFKNREVLEERLHHGGIKLSSRVLVQERASLVSGHSLSVLPVFSDGVKRVDDSQNAGDHRNLFAGLAVGLAASIPALVMMTDYRANRVWEVDPLHDLGSDHGVDLHLLEFGGAELPGFVENVVGHRDLSDVVQQCACLERFDLGLSKSEISCESGGIH